MKVFSMSSISVVLLILCHTAAWCATFKGQVIDADTKQPIEGAVIVASWLEERATPAGPTTRLKDVKETLTDKNGEWVIEGPKGGKVGDIKAIFSFLAGTYFTNPPEFIFFKPGYCSWPEGSIIEVCKQKMKFSGSRKSDEGEILELPKLINKEDMRRSLPTPIHRDGNGEVYRKQGSFIRLLNEESRKLGIGEYDTLKGYEK